VEYPPVDKERGFAILDVLQRMSADRGVSVAQLAVAWLLHRTGVNSVIVGARTEEQLKANLAAATIKLSKGEMAALNDVSALAPEYPNYVPWMRTRGVDLETMRKSLKPAQRDDSGS
jgi:aryl-alcohol dehydrogenase-like predicted oxidoreductase